MNSKKLINLFKWKMDRLSDNLSIKNLFKPMCYVSSLLLCKINVLDTYDMDDFFGFFFILQITEILEMFK